MNNHLDTFNDESGKEPELHNLSKSESRDPSKARRLAAILPGGDDDRWDDDEIPVPPDPDFGAPPSGLLAVLLAPRRRFEKKCAWFSTRIGIDEDDREWRRERVRDYDYDYDGGYELDLEYRLEALDYMPPWWEAPLRWLCPRPLYYRTSLFLGWLLGAPGPFPRWIIWFWRLPLPVQRGLKSLLYHLGKREAAWERQRQKEIERQRREAQPPARAAV